ncbi:IgG-like domain protein [Stenotrophomonas phage C121]|uniref:Hoc-like head decoration n=1 Tax=Stenotrophomonas phage C121 TaxID=2914029 RepID=UPI0023290E85|nr:Hoc-like head decoration [Stenotrophomonas phage C121]UKL14764.1 IgG-like domain protein [Stenotrophomonas phage C121]
MTLYQITVDNSKPMDRKIEVAPDGTAVSEGFTKIGTFEHVGATDPLGPTVNHVLWHHVREALYHVKNAQPPVAGFWPENITDAHTWDIKLIAPVAVTGVTVAPTTSAKTVGQTQQLTPTVAPADATNKAVTYTSGTPAVATVNASGLVTAVSAGTSVITVKTADGNKTATHTITVT